MTDLNHDTPLVKNVRKLSVDDRAIRRLKTHICEKSQKLALENKDLFGINWIEQPIYNPNHSKYMKKQNNNGKEAVQDFVPSKGKWNKVKHTVKEILPDDTEFQSPQALDFMFTLVLTAYNTWKHLSLNNILTNIYLVARIYAPELLQVGIEALLTKILIKYEAFIDLLEQHFLKLVLTDKDKLPNSTKKIFTDWVQKGEMLVYLPEHPNVFSDYAQDHYARWQVDCQCEGSKNFGNCVINKYNLEPKAYLVLNLFLWASTNGVYGEQHLSIAGMLVDNFSVAGANLARENGVIRLRIGVLPPFEYSIPPALLSIYDDLTDSELSSDDDGASELSESEVFGILNNFRVNSSTNPADLLNGYVRRIDATENVAPDAEFQSPSVKKIAFDEFTKAYFGNDNNLFQNGPLGNAARSLMSSLSIAPILLATGKIKNYDDYEKWYNQNVKVWDVSVGIAANLMNFVYTFLSTGLPYLVTGDATYLYPTQTWEKFIQLANSILSTIKDHMRMATVLTTTPEADVIAAVDSVIMFGRNTWMASKEAVPHAMASSMMRLLQQLDDSRSMIHRMYRNKRNNPIPLCVKLYGYTGIGKSQVCKYISSMMCTNVGSKAANNVYYQNPTDKFQSGYTAHEILVMDDVGSENVDNIKNESLLNFLSLSTEVPVMTNQASIEDKGTIPYNLKGIIMTTNYEDAKCRNYFNFAEAFLRRFLHIHIIVKDEFAIVHPQKTNNLGFLQTEVKEKQLDPVKAAGRLDVHHFDVTSFENGVYVPFQYNGKPTLKMEFDEFIMFFREHHLNHISKATASLARTNVIENSEWCATHNTYTFACKCPVQHITTVDDTYELLPYEDNIKRGVKQIDIRAFEGLEGSSLFRALITYNQVESTFLEPTIIDNIKLLGQRIKEKFTIKKIPAEFQGWFKSKILNCFVKHISARDISDVVSTTVHNTIADFRRRRLDCDAKTLFSETVQDFIENSRIKIFLGLGTIGAAIIGLLAIYKSTKFLLESAARFQGMYVRKYATEEEKTQFNDIDVQFTFPGARMPYPPKERVTSQQSITPGHFVFHNNLGDKVENIIKHNTLLMTIDNGIDSYKAWGLALGSNLILVNSHNFNTSKTYKIVAHGDCGSYEQVVIDDHIWRHPENDTSIIMFSAAPFRKIPLASKTMKDIYIGSAKTFRNNSGNYKKFVNPEFTPHSIDMEVMCTKIFHKFQDKIIISYESEDTEVGNCGNPIYVPSLGLVGIHCAGSKLSSKTWYTPICTEDFENATKFFKTKNLLVMVSAPSDCDWQGNIVPSHKNSIVLNTSGNHHVIGSLPGHRARVKSKIRKSLVAEMLPDPGKKIPHMQPILTEDGAWIHPAQVKLQTIAKAPWHINEYVMQKALGFFEEHLRSLLDWKSVRPTGPKEIIQGVPGTISEPMNLSTSSGPGLTGKTKRDHVRYLEEDTDDRIFDKAVMSQVIKVLIAWKKGEMALLHSKWFPKDEPIKPSKEEEGRQRYVSCSPLAKLFFSKMCFRDIFLRIRQSGKTHMCVGMNAASQSWSKIPEKLRTLDPNLERVLDSDYVFYDAYCYLLSRVLAVFIRLLKDNEHYNTPIDFGEGLEFTVNEILNHLATEMVFYPVEVCGELILLIMALESGADSTAEFNSLMETLIHYLIWTQTWLDYSTAKVSEPQDVYVAWFLALDLTPNPNEHLVLFNYGDDNVDTCSKDVAHWYTPSGRQIAAQALGFPITDARKRKELKYVKIDEVVFLKRGFIWNEEAQAYFAPLDESAINQIMYFVKGTSDTIEVLTYNNVRDAHRQYFMYGRKRFDEETIRLKSLLDSAKILNLSDDSWPTFDELLADFKAKTLHMGGL